MKRIDWRWPVMAVLLVGALIVAIVININYEGNTADKIVNSLDIDNGDLKINWDRYQTVDVELTKSLTISESGTYHLTGTLTDGLVVIDAGVSEVRLILDNVTINNSSGPAIVCYNAEDLVIELVGENTLSDGTKYIVDYDEDVNGAIYSKADLALTGDGTLNLTANYADAIVGKDDLVIRDGIYNIVAADDGIRGKDSVYLTAGTLNIEAVADAVKSTNQSDFGKGFVLIEGGSLALVSGDDAIHAEKSLVVNGGEVKVAKSYEGLEAQTIIVNNGEIDIKASDDGINAGGGADNMKVDTNCMIAINGGDIYVDAAGDGIDSNGYLYFNGGTVVVDGPTNNGNGALDAGAGISFQGGKVIAVGASGMAETLGANSGVCNLSVYFDSTLPAGTLVEVRSSAGETILSHTSAKSFNHMAAGSEALVPGETYTIYVDGSEYQTFTITEVLTTIGNSNTNQYNMPSGAPNNMPGDMPDDMPRRR